MKPLRKIVLAGLGRFSAGAFHAPAAALGQLESRSPSDPSDVLGTFPYGEEDVDEAVAAAMQGSTRWRQTSLTMRINALRRLEKELATRLPELTLRLGREQGRPPWECGREGQGLVARLSHTLNGAKSALEDRGFDDLDARLAHRPHGVVAVLGPAMLPISTSHTHIVAALVAGNCVVWKPSHHAPAAAQLYTEALHAATLPPGAFNMVQGDDDVGRRLASHPGVDAVVFTGSRKHGLELRKALVMRPETPLILHLGSKNPAVVMENADLERAAREITTSAFLTAGQRCTALSRVMVHDAVLGAFLEHLLRAVKRLHIGAPTQSTFMGPMLSPGRRDAFLAVRERATAEGASLLYQGAAPATGCFAAPSVHLVADRRLDSAYQRDEHFGPDLAVYPVKDFEDALEVAESTGHVLCASIFCNDRKRWDALSAELRVSNLFWNRGSTAPSGRLPFGGGQGAPGGALALEALRRQVPLQWGTGPSFPGTGARDPADGDDTDADGAEDDDA